MEHIIEFPCGCKIVLVDNVTADIHYCPKHKSAPDLYEACKELEQYLAQRPAKDKQLLAYQATLIKAIAKAESK